MFSTERIRRAALIGVCLLVCLCACDTTVGGETPTGGAAVTESGTPVDTEITFGESVGGETERTEPDSEPSGQEPDAAETDSEPDSEPDSGTESATDPLATDSETAEETGIELPKVEFD